MQTNFEAIPGSLRERNQWVLWRLENGNRKMPYQTDGKLAKTNNPTTWDSFANVLKMCWQYTGVGFVFSPDDDFVGIDLDGCRDPQSGIISEWAKEIIARFDSYAEVSPSETGVKIFCRGKWAFETGKNVAVDADAVCVKSPGIEAYDHVRYFTVTGVKLDDIPDEPQERQEAIDWLVAKYFSSKHEEKKHEDEKHEKHETNGTWTRTANGSNHPFGQAVLEKACGRILAAVDGQKHFAVRDAAFNCGHFIPSCYSFDEAEHALRGAIATRGCADLGLAWKTIATGLRKGAESPEVPPERDGGPEPQVDWNTFSGKQAKPGPEATNSEAPPGNTTSDQWGDPIPLNEDPSVPEFPVDVLPGQLPQLARELAWAMNAPIDYAGVSMLVLAAGAIGNTYRLKLSETHSQPALIFAAMVGLPGSAKSPVLKHLTRPFDALQIQWNDEYNRDLERWNKAEKETRGEKPQLKTCISRNFTSESLALSLHYNQRGFVAPLDELSSLFAGLNQYKPGGGGNDRQVYLSVWAQETINILRKNDMRMGIPPIWVCNPCLSIVGGIQPDMLASIRGRGSFRGEAAPNDGGLDRFLFCWPKVQPETADEGRRVSPELLEAWPQAIDNLLLNLQLDEGGSQVVHLSSQARRAYVEFTQRHADEINSGELPEHLRGPWAKLKGYVPRLALTLHLLRWACGERLTIASLEEDTMRRAVQLVEYFKGHARKLHACIDNDPKAAGAKKALKWILAAGCNRFQKREAYQQTKGTFKTVEVLDGILSHLEKHNFIRQEQQPGRGGPGRKSSPWYQVNPKLSGNCGDCGNSGP